MNNTRKRLGIIIGVVLLLGMAAISIYMIIIPVKRLEMTGEISVYNKHENRYRIENKLEYRPKEGDADGVDVGKTTYKRSITLGIFCLLMTACSGYIIWSKSRYNGRG